MTCQSFAGPLCCQVVMHIHKYCLCAAFKAICIDIVRLEEAQDDCCNDMWKALITEITLLSCKSFLVFWKLSPAEGFLQTPHCLFILHSCPKVKLRGGFHKCQSQVQFALATVSWSRGDSGWTANIVLVPLLPLKCVKRLGVNSATSS